jgi:hypothetical protein
MLDLHEVEKKAQSDEAKEIAKEFKEAEVSFSAR